MPDDHLPLWIIAAPNNLDFVQIGDNDGHTYPLRISPATMIQCCQCHQFRKHYTQTWDGYYYCVCCMVVDEFNYPKGFIL